MSSSDSSSSDESSKPGPSSTSPQSSSSSPYLEQLEAEFKDRYTDRDKEYVAQYKRELSKPPCFHPWVGSRNNRQYQQRS